MVKNREFHFCLYRNCRMPTLLLIIESLWLQIGPFIRKSAEYFDARDGRGAEFHIAAVAAMRRRDAVQVGRAVAADINRSLDVIREVMFTADAAA